MTQHPVALWQQLTHVGQATAAVMAGASLNTALDAMPPDLRPGVQALSFHVLRHWGHARALRRQLAPRTPPAQADALLCTALVLLACEAQSDCHYDAFTVVNQAVEAARRQPATRRQTAWVNACLRRYLRERGVLEVAIAHDAEARWNHPQWWIAQLQQDHPTHWQALLQANNTPAPMVLRINSQRGTVADYMAQLAPLGMAAQPLGAMAIRLQKPLPVQQLPGFAEGWFVVQDAAAQIAAPLLLDGLPAAQPGQPLRLLDACAAPGGKTTHLLELAPEAQVWALEADRARSQRIHDNLRRLNQHAQVVVADASQPGVWWDGHRFDGILLDAPCSASGIVRRHPDIRWLRRPSDIAALTQTQASLLDALWPLLRPGGRMVYCTCSVFRAEGQQAVESFVSRNKDAHLLPSPGHLLPQAARQAKSVWDNGACDQDGFFYARMEKSSP